MERLDKELVNRKLVDSRVRAQELIKKNLVVLNGKAISKSSQMVSAEDVIEILDNDVFKYVSRGGFKLEKALKSFGYDIKDKVVMDIGSSTGGFTDCCLQGGAKKMVCIDVGTDVMHPNLRNHPKVNLYENTNFKDVSSDLFTDIDVAVIDVSFISLNIIFNKLANEDKKIDVLCLIKPQFECGREIANKYSGVILNKNIHADILSRLIANFQNLGFNCKGLDYSPIKGGDGNIEYIGYFSNKNNDCIDIDIDTVINIAFGNL